MRYFLLALFFVLCGCNTTRQIASKNNEVRRLAVESSVSASDARANIESAVAEYAAGRDPRAHLGQASEQIGRVIDNSDLITSISDNFAELLSNVEDKDGIFVQFLRGLSWNWWITACAVGLVSLAVVAWKFGPLITGMGLMSKTAMRGGAKLLSEGRASEAGAVLRSSAQFDREFRKAKRVV